MTGNELLADFGLIVMKAGPVDKPLTASQLSAIVTAAESLILNAVSLAPCSHPGSRYSKEGEDREICGVCSRPIEDDWRESLASA